MLSETRMKPILALALVLLVPLAPSPTVAETALRADFANPLAAFHTPTFPLRSGSLSEPKPPAIQPYPQALRRRLELDAHASAGSSSPNVAGSLAIAFRGVAGGPVDETPSWTSDGPVPVEPISPPPAISAPRQLTWRQSDRSVALLNQGRMVWEHVHDPQIGKPYMRFGLLDGTELTRPWPVPKDYPRNDHSWHRALWWSWKMINGVNYWEGNQTGTEPVQATIATQPDGSARIELTIAYHRPDEPPVVQEKRTVTVSAPDAGGTYFIDWEACFTPTGKDDVRFDQNSYGGFALRLAAECCGDAARQIPAWTFGNSEGQADPNNRAARWVSYQGTAANGQPAGVAIFDHPDNPRHPALWQTRAQYPYLNPSLTCREAYVLPAGKTLRLRYGVLIAGGSLDAAALEQRWKALAGTTARPE